LQPIEADETLAWRAATIIMIFVTVVTFTLWILGFGPFTDIFDGFIVYIPTAILLGTSIYEKLKRPSDQTDYIMRGQSSVENKAA
jgi:hypothetical protein